MAGGTTNLLVVEDDPFQRETVCAYLTNQGFQVEGVGDGAAFRAAVAAAMPDAALLDVGLPGGDDGFALARWLRGQSGTVGIIMLTAATDLVDRVVGLESGADDYITKPFSPSELIARVQAVLRRSRPALAAEALTYGDIVMDLAAHRVFRGNKPVHLRPTEFRLLRFLIEHPGRVFSREQLLNAVWTHDTYIEPRTVDVHIRRLRKALNVGGKEDVIRTVRATGYSLESDGFAAAEAS
jgi:two-component system phosphate regulon response regulator PhoB